MAENTKEKLDKIVADHSQIMPGKTQEVTASGELFTIAPFKFPQYAKAISAVTKILSILNLQDRLSNAAKILMSEKGEDAEVSLEELLGGLLSFDVITQVCDEAPEEIIKLMALATNKPRVWFDALEADEGLELAGAVIGVNLSFFIQKIVPAIAKTVNNVKAGLSQQLMSSPMSNPENLAS